MTSTRMPFRLVDVSDHELYPRSFGIQVCDNVAYAPEKLVNRLRKLTIATVADLLEVAERHPELLADTLGWTSEEVADARTELASAVLDQNHLTR